MLVEKQFDTGEVVLNYAEGPDNGPPMLLIHGFPRWWKDFQPIIPTLLEKTHVYALDLRGHGKSGRTRGHYSLNDYKRDAIKLLEKHIKEPTILFGHSMGGWISLMVAAERPEYVKAIIIGDSPLNLRDWRDVLKGPLSEWLTTNIDHSMKEYDELVKEIDEESALRLSLLDPDVFTLWIEGSEDVSAYNKFLGGYDIRGLSCTLSSTGCPVLILQGNDQTLRDEDVAFIKSVLPDVTHVYLESHGHYLGLDTGEVSELLEALMPFLESLR